MKREGLLRHLRRHGCVLKREGGSHSLWCTTWKSWSSGAALAVLLGLGWAEPSSARTMALDLDGPWHHWRGTRQVVLLDCPGGDVPQRGILRCETLPPFDGGFGERLTLRVGLGLSLPHGDRVSLVAFVRPELGSLASIYHASSVVRVPKASLEAVKGYLARCAAADWLATDREKSRAYFAAVAEGLTVRDPVVTELLLRDLWKQGSPWLMLPEGSVEPWLDRLLTDDRPEVRARLAALVMRMLFAGPPPENAAVVARWIEARSPEGLVLLRSLGKRTLSDGEEVRDALRKTATDGVEPWASEAAGALKRLEAQDKD